jgi:Osteopetrosis-associated transmembrane protein 1 precursor
VKECVDENLHNSSICDICRHPYHNLNSYYNEIKLNAEETENGNVCMDVVDLV